MRGVQPYEGRCPIRGCRIQLWASTEADCPEIGAVHVSVRHGRSQEVARWIAEQIEWRRTGSAREAGR